MSSPTIIRNSDPNARNLEWDSLPEIGQNSIRREQQRTRLLVAALGFVLVVALATILAAVR